MHYHQSHVVAAEILVMSHPTDLTADDRQIELLLDRLNKGDESAMDVLLPLLFEDLRRLARAQRNRLGGGETLRTTALIHEAYLKMRRSASVSTESRRHFLHTAALAMRQILIDHARSELAAQDRNQLARMRDESTRENMHQQARLVLDIDAALGELQAIDPRLVNVVTYRYFAGYSEAETADLMAVSKRTIRRDWFKAKVWLAEKLDAHDITQAPQI